MFPSCDDASEQVETGLAGGPRDAPFFDLALAVGLGLAYEGQTPTGVAFGQKVAEILPQGTRHGGARARWDMR